MSTDLATRPNGRGEIDQQALDAQDVIRVMDTIKAVKTFIQKELIDGVDYGLIPGVTKKCLLKPGAEKVAMFFNTRARRRIKRHEIDYGEEGSGHVEFIVTTELVSRTGGDVIGEGSGSCSTMEGRYRFRKASLRCPKCGQETVIAGKQEYGGGYLCYGKKGGCGAKFRENDPAIVNQPRGQAENENLWDIRNTVLKMAVKRADVAAALSVGCLSEIFTQDVEEFKTFDIDAAYAEYQRNSAADPEDPRDAADREARQGINAEFDRQRGPDVAKNHDNGSGHGSGAYADPKTVAAFNDWVEGRCQIANTKWADALTEHNVEPTLKKHQQIIEPFQLKGHILKWARQNNLINAPEGTTVDQTMKFAALVWQRDPKAVGEEYKHYLARLIATAKAELGFDENWEPCDPPDNDGCSDRPEDIDGPNA